MLVRPWQESDLTQIEELERECFEFPWNYEMLKSSFNLPNFCGLVIEDCGKILGYIGSTFIFEIGEILLVAVGKEYRRNGYAQILLRKNEETLKEEGVERILLEVRKSNFPAQNCYLKDGYSEIGERKGYYENGEDAIIMEKRI